MIKLPPSKEIFREIIKDLVTQLYQYMDDINLDLHNKHQFHFSAGTIEDVCIDMMNAYNNPTELTLGDLDQSIEKFIKRECGKEPSRLLKC